MYGRCEMHPAVREFLALLETEQQTSESSIPGFARRLHVSTCHLEHLVKRDIGLSCSVLIRAKRVERASALLTDRPNQGIAEIAYQCGYEPQTMYRHFIAVLGISPRRFAEEGGETVCAVAGFDCLFAEFDCLFAGSALVCHRQHAMMTPF